MAGYLSLVNFALILCFITNSISEILAIPSRKEGIIEHLTLWQEVYELTLNYVWEVSETRNAGMMVPSCCHVYSILCDQMHKIILNPFLE